MTAIKPNPIPSEGELEKLIADLHRILSRDNGHCGESTSERIAREREQDPIRRAIAMLGDRDQAAGPTPLVTSSRGTEADADRAPTEGELIERLRDGCRFPFTIAETEFLMNQAADALQALIGERKRQNPARIWDDERKVFVRPSDHCTATDTGARSRSAIGPRPAVFVCTGCPAYETEKWREPSGDGETYDNGQYAWCNAADRRSMGAYHYDHSPAPEWCPALPNVPVDGRLRAAQVQSDRLEIATGGGLAESGGPTRAAESAKP